MSRSVTAIKGKLWVWNDNDNPGAGTKGVTKVAGGTGLNANWEALDYLYVQHNDDGTHQDATIKGSNLIQSGANACVDETTIEFSGNKARVKDASITGGEARHYLGRRLNARGRSRVHADQGRRCDGGEAGRCDCG